MGESESSLTANAKPRRSWPRLLLIAVLVVLVVTVVRGLIGDVDWVKVRQALAQLAPWQAGILLLGLLLRQTLNALPLALFIPGCSPLRAVQNDQAAILMTTVAPPPSDIVMRLAMFTSWGVPAHAGLAGTVMNTVSFYVVRFGAPMVGIVLMILIGSFDPYELSAAVLSGLVSVSLLLVVWLAFRDADFAARLALRLGQLARSVRLKVDPASWAQWATDFRNHIADRVPWALPRSLLALMAMVTVDATLIVTAIRFVGVTSTQVPATEVLVAFLIAYPLTLFPFSGLGILDALVIATLVAFAGEVVEPGLVAGFVVWRAITIITPLLLGMAAVGHWKYQVFRVRPES